MTYPSVVDESLNKKRKERKESLTLALISLGIPKKQQAK